MGVSVALVVVCLSLILLVISVSLHRILAPTVNSWQFVNILLC